MMKNGLVLLMTSRRCPREWRDDFMRRLLEDCSPSNFVRIATSQHLRIIENAIALTAAQCLAPDLFD